jgi:hypothetical protein
MLIDHVGAVFFPKYLIYRIIGRLAFPMFAYFIAEGYRKSKDVTDYLGRLFLFGFISQMPFSYAFNLKELYLNVFFTLAMGLYALYSYDKHKKLYMVVIIAAVCQIMNTDYGAFGVALVFVFNKYHEDFKAMAKNVILLTVVFQAALCAYAYFTMPTAYLERALLFRGVIQPLCLFSLVFLRFYNHERGLRLKYIFYAFYPVHLLLIAVLR